VLDEATAALDSQAEAEVQSAINRLEENRTVICIAHRLSTLSTMDKIIVLAHAAFWNKAPSGIIGAWRPLRRHGPQARHHLRRGRFVSHAVLLKSYVAADGRRIFATNIER